MAVALGSSGVRAQEPPLPDSDPPIARDAPADRPADPLPAATDDPPLPGAPADVDPGLLPAGEGLDGPPAMAEPGSDVPPPDPAAFDPGAPPRSPPTQDADGTVSVLAAPPVAPPTSFPPVPTAPPMAAPPVAPPVATTPAAALVSRGLEPPSAAGADSWPQRPLPLLEALERSGDRSRRLWITQSYWKLTAAAARLRFAAEAEERLSLVAPGSDADDLALLDVSLAEARGEVAAAGADLAASQQELVDLVRLPIQEPAPWPADAPLVSAYQTHFETIFSARPATGRVRAIHRQLPLLHRSIVARSEAVEAARRRFESMEALHARGKRPIGAVLSAHATIVSQEGAFVGAVREYNLAIAEYVMAVADLSVPDDRFAVMLIGQPIPWRQQVPAGGQDRVVPVSGAVAPPTVPGDALPRDPQPPARFAPAFPPPPFNAAVPFPGG